MIVRLNNKEEKNLNKEAKKEVATTVMDTGLGKTIGKVNSDANNSQVALHQTELTTTIGQRIPREGKDLAATNVKK